MHEYDTNVPEFTQVSEKVTVETDNDDTPPPAEADESPPATTPDSGVDGTMNISASVQNVPSEEVGGDIVLAGDGIALPAEPEEEEELTLPGGEKGILAEIDAKNFRVMRGRDREKPDPKRVRRIKLAVKNNRPVRRVRVYRDKESGELFSPNGGHRQQAYDELGMRVPVVIFDIENAEERAELESCFANEDNGSGRSSADMRYQAEKALGILTKKLNRIPKPRELAAVLQIDEQYARRFLHRQFSGNVETDTDDEPESGVPVSLRKILDGLKKIIPPSDWVPGCASKPILAEIRKEVMRIANHTRPINKITPAEIKEFMERHRLDRQDMAALMESTPQTIGRWLAGSVKMSEANARILRQVLMYTEEQIRTLLDSDKEERDG